MTDCPNAGIRDLLPDLIHGRLRGDEKSRVESHVAACADCSAELRVLRAVHGSRPAFAAADSARIGSAIPAYEAPSSGRKWLRVAAAVVVASLAGLGVWSSGGDADRRVAAVAPAPAPPVTTDSIVPAIPGSVSPVVVASADSPRIPAAAPAAVPSSIGMDIVSELDGVSDSELAALTSELESLDSRPVSEPDNITLISDDETEDPR